LFGKTSFGLNSYCIQYHIMATYIAPPVHKMVLTLLMYF
jgi:hypothetical protein